MSTFSSYDGTKLAYELYGTEDERPPVLLLHGFAADTHANWVRPHVIDALVEAGRHVVTLDARGHGRSDKPHDPAAYADDAMVRDAEAILDHLGVELLDGSDDDLRAGGAGASSPLCRARRGRRTPRGTRPGQASPAHR